jgi:urease accessory protein
MLDIIALHYVNEKALNAPHSAECELPSCDSLLQRAKGVGRVAIRGSPRGNQIVDLFQCSPIRVMLPRIGAGGFEEVVFINTGGGIAGGDHLGFVLTALADASVVGTSQTAERVYRALSKPARVTTKLRANEGSKLAWLPQETIFFNGARLIRTTEVELVSGAELLALEWLVLGRAAHGEEILTGHIAENWRVTIDGRLTWADCFLIEEETFPHLQNQALLAANKAIATLIYFGRDLRGRLELLRELVSSLRCRCEATIIGGLVVVRFVSEFASVLRSALREFLKQIAHEFGPGHFGVPKMWSC